MTHTFKYFNGFWSTPVIMLIDQILLSLATWSLFRLVLNYFLRILVLFVHFLAPQAFSIMSPSSYGDNGPIYNIISLQGGNGDIQILEN